MVEKNLCNSLYSDMDSSDELLLPTLLSRSKSAEHPTEFLLSKLNERALSTYNKTLKKDPKPQRGIALLQVCATESDVEVSERDDLVRDSSPIVGALLPVVKSEAVFGRDGEKELLLSQLVREDPRELQLAVIPVVGRAGIGKTTLARLVYRDRAAVEHFELRAWVEMDVVARDDRGLEHQLLDIARKLLRSATGMSCTSHDAAEVVEMVVDTVLSRRSLIVLDGFESPIAAELWGHLEATWFRFLGLGSKVVVTSRDIRLAEVCVSSPLHLDQLSRADSWSLYSSLASPPSGEGEMAPPSLGVPLSLRLLGSLARFEGTFHDFMEGATNFLEPSMALPVAVLALPQHLFNCFAYCGVFPRGHMLDKEKLIQMWIADGLLEGPGSLEDAGEAYLEELISRSYFSDITCNEYGDVVQVRMHNPVHELAQQIAGIVYKDKIGYAFDVESNSLHLSIAPLFQQVYNSKNLQTLLSFRHKSLHQSLTITNQSFDELKRLRSLDLSKSGIRKLSKSVCMLRKLRFLNLSRTLLTKLPKSFTTLTRLQTLDLSRCYYLKSLPKKMANLSKLRHLDLSHCNSLSHMPLGIEHLNSLITMPLFVSGDKDSSKCLSLRVLGMLHELKGVLVIKNLENVMEFEEAQAADLKRKKLRHLGLHWSHKVYECQRVLECLEPNPELRVLELKSYGGNRFPAWIPNLACLVKLSINDCRCTMLPRLGELGHLKELELIDLINVISIDQEFYGNGDDDVFPSLERLKLHDVPNLNNWSDHSSSSKGFRQLKRLSIQGCPELQTLPSLPSITELVVSRSNTVIVPLLTRSGSLSSIVMNEMNVRESFRGSSSSSSVKKVIIVHNTDLYVLKSSHLDSFRALQHLRILHCPNLEYVKLHKIGSLEKLNVVDCQILRQIDLIAEDFALTEVIVEDCPQLEKIDVSSSSSLRKLIVRNCPKFSMPPYKIEELQGLEFFFITGCPKMEKRDDEKS